MSLNSLIISTLTPLGFPVAFQALSPEEKALNPHTYITFFEYNQRGALFADDEEIKSAHSIQVDIWSKYNYSNLVKQVKGSLKKVGFTRIMETEFYEDEIEFYHKVIRFSFTQEGGI
ncbi:hypothetical protein KHA94_00255 [Bacillus sp. FJAT-49705]|uniref:DUF3168 domain-containing protein n=1 Tax=Cytobacillus citreus TaxID=2833586 RepID=A0ABS5NLG2_9BACI|nr:hypothetical protein [Cytobacillus citreus]MBS4188651.1 hypothetical protein [Cytobacillus citreus]